MSNIEKVYDDAPCAECHEYPHHPDCTLNRLAQRIAVLEAQLAEVMKDLDAANQHVIIVRESRDILHDERDTLRTQLSTVTAKLQAMTEEAGDRIAKLQLRLAETLNDLRAVVEALRANWSDEYGHVLGCWRLFGLGFCSTACEVTKRALDSPGVRAILEEPCDSHSS